MDASAHFRGKKITVMGLGLLGRGVGDAKYLAECGAELIVTDLKTREELASSVAQLESFPNITFVLGEHRLEDFTGRDMILKAAGVPLDSIYIAEAKKNNIPIRMSADLFAEISGITCIGVTGTRGKSTVTHMIFSILQTAYDLGLSRGAAGLTGKPVLGGNVRGVSTLALLREVREVTPYGSRKVSPREVAVLELDSWQLQGWGEAMTSPHIAVFTTLFPDHLNYYRDHLEQYLADKANIFLCQKSDDTLILGKQCAAIIIEKYADKIDSKTIIADELKLPDTWTLCILGMHNRYNAALALAGARALDIPDEVSRKALTAFAGVPGRLELIAEKNGVKIYNDTTATTPEATLAALAALTGIMSGRGTSRHDESGFSQSIILILGGADKGLEMGALVAKLPELKRVILLAGSGTERIRAGLPGATVYDALAPAVADAFVHAEAGDTILLSPAFASFGMFKNEYDRGDQFNVIVKALK